MTEQRKSNVTCLVALREKYGLTQESLAEALGVSRSFVALIETGKKALPDERAARAEDDVIDYTRDRDRDREVMRRAIDEVMPWTEEDEAWLRLERRRRERMLEVRR